jgi:hypothetical protein
LADLIIVLSSVKNDTNSFVEYVPGSKDAVNVEGGDCGRRTILTGKVSTSGQASASSGQNSWKIMTEFDGK